MKGDFPRKLELVAEMGLIKQEDEIGSLVRELFFSDDLRRKLVSVVSILGKLVPEVGIKAIKKGMHLEKFESFENLPFNFSEIEITDKIGVGVKSRVYLLKSKNKSSKSFVVKVKIPIDYKNKEELQRIAKNSHEDYKKFVSFIKRYRI